MDPETKNVEDYLTGNANVDPGIDRTGSYASRQLEEIRAALGDLSAF